MADCDGYSDAFYLVGTLAGLKIRFQHGNAKNTGFYGFLDSTTHMWNLIELNGTWRLVDLTWDDSDDGISRTWFNLGDDRASRSHIWNRDMSVTLLEKTDLSSRPENEFSVTTSEEMEKAITRALDQGFLRFDLIFDDESFSAKDEALRLIGRKFNGSVSYAWDEHVRLLTIYLREG